MNSQGLWGEYGDYVAPVFQFREHASREGQWNVHTDVYSCNIPLEAFRVSLGKLGMMKSITGIPHALVEDQKQAINSLIPAELPEQQRAEVFNRILCQEYLLVVEKNEEGVHGL